MAGLTAVSLLIAASAFAAEPIAVQPKKVVATNPKPQKGAKTPVKNLVDINTASKAELKKLPSITDAYADKIIAGRPYLSKAHLLTRKILPSGIYDAVKKHVAAKGADKVLEQMQKSGKK